MAENGRLSRKQERFLQALLLGETIVAAAKSADVGERTARRWLTDVTFKAERTRREAEIQQAEQAEIERILTTGYAAIHKRVEALDKLAREMELPYTSSEGKVYHLRNSPDHVKEWRGLLDDIAKELGQRVKKQEIEHSGLVDLLNSEHASLLAELGALPDVRQSQEPPRPTGTDTASPSA